MGTYLCVQSSENVSDSVDTTSHEGNPDIKTNAAVLQENPAVTNSSSSFTTGLTAPYLFPAFQVWSPDSKYVLFADLSQINISDLLL